jgi:hypothetical protein
MAALATVIDWHVHPFRADRWLAGWLPAAERAMSFGARGWTITRSKEDPLLFRQTIFWDDTDSFDNYWASDEVSAARQEVLSFYNKPLLPIWHSVAASEGVLAGGEELVAAEAEE